MTHADDGGLLGRHLQPLLDQRDDVWLEMVSTIQDRLPTYLAFATQDDQDQWGTGVLRLFDLFLELAVQDRWLTNDETEGIRATGATRFDQGFEVGEVRASVRIAIGVARTRIVREYSPKSPEDKEAMDRVLALLDRYGNEVADLLREGFEARRGELVSGNRDDVQFVDDLASGRLTTDKEFSRRVEALGFDATASLCFVLLADTAAGADVTTRLKDRFNAKAVLHRSAAGPPHRLLIAQAHAAHDCSRVSDAAREVAADAQTTAVVAGPCRGLAECHDRYGAAAVLVPHIASLAEGRAVLQARELTLYSVVVALPPPAREWLRRDVLRGLERNQKVFEFLRDSIRFGFVLNDVERGTDLNIKTIYKRRDELERATGRTYFDVMDQTVLALAYCAARLGA
jgi:hypothetical protein